MTPKQKKALAALLTYPTRREAAAAAGVSERTMRDYLSNDEFQAEYRAALSGLIDDAAAQAKMALSPALKTLLDIAVDTGENSAARISASKGLLDYGLKLTEINDIRRDLEEIDS